MFGGIFFLCIKKRSECNCNECHAIEMNCQDAKVYNKLLELSQPKKKHTLGMSRLFNIIRT